MRTFAGIARLAACWAAPLLWAHGLIEEPPSRSWVCGVDTKPDEIKWGTAKTPACSTAFAVNPVAAYDYMAVLSHTLGRSEVEPLPAYVCGFASEKWNGTETPWDAPMDWPVNPVSPGPINIKWNIVWGPHFDDTKEFKYWITKSDFVFSPAKALSWDDFEAEPFCSLPYDDTHPTANPDVTADKAASTFVTRCTLPQRSGHHVIYGEWGRTPPTYERFHSCFDAQFGSTGIRIPFRPGFPAGRPVPEKTESGVDALGRLRPAERPGILSRPSRPADMR